MNADLELLKLAAKAAGLDVNFEEYDDPADWFPNGYDVDNGDVEQWWNPLRSDGDALRLAVSVAEKLPCLMLGIYGRAEFPHVGASIVHREGGETYVEQEYADDINAALRRCIVRAAAEIGRAMP